MVNKNEIFTIDKMEEIEWDREIQIFEENMYLLEELQKIANDNYNEALGQLKTEIINKFKELNIYANIIPINNFLSSLFSEEKEKYKERFYKYINSKGCTINFYEMFNDQINRVHAALLVKNNRASIYNEISCMRQVMLNKCKSKNE